MSHWLHLYNCSPLWLLKCLFRLIGSEDAKSHFLHLFASTPISVVKCVLILQDAYLILILNFNALVWNIWCFILQFCHSYGSFLLWRKRFGHLTSALLMSSANWFSSSNQIKYCCWIERKKVKVNWIISQSLSFLTPLPSFFLLRGPNNVGGLGLKKSGGFGQVCRKSRYGQTVRKQIFKQPLRCSDLLVLKFYHFDYIHNSGILVGKTLMTRVPMMMMSMLILIMICWWLMMVMMMLMSVSPIWSWRRSSLVPTLSR